PAVMLGAFEQACEAAGIAHVHLERFAPAPDAAPPAAAASGYTVELARSGKSVRVEPGATLLDSLLAAGADVQTSCLEGICGTCETRVLEGCPDHRDSVLSAAERATNKVMMICVSGCKGERLVLDL
ncbi:MAG: 2Fe-2S iron-sulfur cluster binding domain-containing protein, partial [Burkholderiales bacterium]|nr:2Fe-2S iron-sulfur cluster binding domain-containing protein [Burkholderiales bacterium]